MQHPPHRLDVLGRVAPVAPGVEVAEVELVLQAGLNARHRAGDLAGHERLAAAFALVVEQDSVDREHVVRLAVVHRDPVAVDLGRAIRRARVKRRLLVLRRGSRAEHLRTRRLVEPGRDPRRANRLEQPDRAETRDVAGVVGHLEADLDVALRTEVVDLVGRHRVHQVDQPDAVVQVAVVQPQPHVGCRAGLGKCGRVARC